MSVICIRDFSSLRCTRTAKTLTLTGLHVLGNLGWQIGQWAWRQAFQHEGLKRRPQLGQFLRQAGRDLPAALSVISVTFSPAECADRFALRYERPEKVGSNVV